MVEQTITVGKEILLRGKRESFYAAECLRGHQFREQSELTDEAFLKMSCPECGATLEISYTLAQVVAVEAVGNDTQKINDLRARCNALEVERTLRPLSEWHEDSNPFALWWALPIDEPPYCGSPNDDNWPGYHTHWTPIPLPIDIPAEGESPEGN